MEYQLYLIVNLKNNKRYVGQCSEDRGYEVRFNEHLYESRHGDVKRMSVLHKAIRKYGEDNFQLRLLFHDIPEKYIDELEVRWIEKLNTFYLDGHGYNMTKGGQGIHGYKHSSETKARMSAANKAYRPTQDTLLKAEETKRRNNWYEHRRLHTDWRKNLSVAMKKRFENEPATWLGRNHTDESKLKIAKARGAAVVMIDSNTDEVIERFFSCIEAAKYLIAIGKTKNPTANGPILEVCHGRAKTAYGFKWRFDSSVTTNPDECKDVE